jgi:hypothetical protein
VDHRKAQLNSVSLRQLKKTRIMGSVFIIKGILIYIYGFDHNPPHIHVKSGNGTFTITIKDRIVEGKGRAKDIQVVNKFIDEHEAELLEIFEKAQRGEFIKKVQY